MKFIGHKDERNSRGNWKIDYKGFEATGPVEAITLKRNTDGGRPRCSQYDRNVLS